jgi:hypothetical protein
MNHISPTERNQALGRAGLGAVMAVVGLTLLVYNGKWFWSAWRGPTAITMEELRQLQDPAGLDNPWVYFTFGKSIDTNLGLVRTKSGQQTTPKSKFLLIQVKDRWLIAEVPHNFGGSQLTGYLDVWGTPLRRESIDRIKAEAPEQANLLLPYQLDGEYKYRVQCFSMAGIAGFLLMTGVVLTYNGLKVYRHRPAPKSYGQIEPGETAEQAD